MSFEQPISQTLPVTGGGIWYRPFLIVDQDRSTCTVIIVPVCGCDGDYGCCDLGRDCECGCECPCVRSSALFPRECLDNTRYFSFLEQCKDAKACTVLLRGGSKDVLNEVERNLADAMQVR